MKKGIIIIFGKSDVNILDNLFLKLFLNKEIKFCLVNNGNNQKVPKLLQGVKKTSKSDISILTLKREKKLSVAIKAGARFLSAAKDIGIIIHIRPSSISSMSLIERVLKISDKDLFKKKDERILLRRVYSINEIINC